MSNMFRKLGKARALLMTALWLRPRFGGIGLSTVMYSPRTLFNPNRVRIGAHCLVEAQSTFYAITQFGGQSFEPSITIGDRAYINHSFNITAANRVVIGNDVLIAFNVAIFDNNHGFTNVDMPIKQQPLRVYPRGVEICDGAWIGANVFICGNVRIGRNAVVGANSVVKNDVPDHAIVAGNPARLLKMISPTMAREPIK